MSPVAFREKRDEFIPHAVLRPLPGRSSAGLPYSYFQRTKKASLFSLPIILIAYLMNSVRVPGTSPELATHSHPFGLRCVSPEPQSLLNGGHYTKIPLNAKKYRNMSPDTYLSIINSTVLDLILYSNLSSRFFLLQKLAYSKNNLYLPCFLGRIKMPSLKTR